MTKLQDSDVSYAKSYLATMIHHVRSIISDDMEVKEVLPQSLDSAQNIIEEIVVFTTLESNSRLATELTSKPYLIKP
jgi:hypothetical protein